MTGWIETWAQDLRYAFRALRHERAFALVALLSLALGIGATTAIYSVIHGVLIAPYPYARPGEIWAPQVRALDGRGGRGYALDELRDLSALPAFSSVMATSIEPVLLTGQFAPESFNGVLLSANAFNFLGVPPVAGRTLQPTDVASDGEAQPVVVLSHKLWVRLFGGDPGAVGQTLRLNGRPHTIVGVMPPRFGWYGNDGFWLPLSPTRTDVPWINPIMRLAPGVSRAVAEQQLDAFNRRLAAAKPGTFPAAGFTTSLRNYLDVTVASGEMRSTLRLLFGGVAFLLLIACANVANLQLARGTARAREMAIRMSVGAGRRRLLRQLLTESTVLSLAGGALGILFAVGAIHVIVGLMPEFYVPNEARVAVNTPVLAFSVLVSVATGMLFGLVPAFHTSKPDVTDVLKAARSTGASGHGAATRNLLVVVEVGLAVVLLVSAGLTVRTFQRLLGVDVGFSAERVLMVGLPLPPAKYDTLAQRNAFAEDLLERVERLPGVEAATIGVPLGGPRSPFAIHGKPEDDSRRIAIELVGASHLRTYGIPLRAGRMLEAAEVRRGDRVAVINEAAARLWPDGESPVGARLRLGLLQQAPSQVRIDAKLPPEVTIVGIIGDTRNAGLREETFPAVAIPYTVIAPPQRTVAIKAYGDPALLVNAVRAQVREIDGDQPLGRIITLTDILGQQVVQPRFTMALFSAFAGVGLALAAAGIFSVLSFHVTRRTHELGVRLALGASRGHVLALLLSMGGRLVVSGLALGVAASLASTRLLRSQLFGVHPADPLAYAAVALLLGVVAFVACYIPARRAAAVDPVVALRQE
ncbi:MAG TPA: ABC transporter permease [Vicinamibacterales bacterium]|nr:ABC transporter permease [Vicinamibacterales bacterium]